MRLYFSALLLLSFAALFAADTPEPQRVDPMLWKAPEGQPKISPRVPLDRSALNSALARLGFLLEGREKLPEHGIEIISIVPASQAETLGLALGDLVLKIDGKPVLLATDFNRLRTDKPQMVSIYSKGTGAKEIEIQPGKFGAELRVFNRDNPMGFTGNWSDPRWADEVRIASFLVEGSPELAEAALAKAVAAGMEQNAAVNRFIAQLNINNYRYDEAMTFAYATLQQAPDDNMAVSMFIFAAAANYKLEALVEFLKAHPKLPLNENLETFERLVKEHKALPETKRVCLSPRVAAKKMFKDDLTVRGEGFQFWKRPDPKNENAERTLVVDKRIHSLLDEHSTRFELDPGTFYFNGFKPAAKNIYVRCRFFVQPTDKVDNVIKRQFLNLFRIALFPYDEKKGKTLDDHADMLTGLGLAVTPGYPSYLTQDHFLNVFKYALPNLNKKDATIVNDGKSEMEIVLAVVDGSVEIIFNGNRVFYGPLGIPDSKLFVTYNAIGTTGSIQIFDVFELLTDEERDANVKPSINTHYRNGMTRMHAAGLHYDKPQIQQLLKLGAKFDLKDDNGLTSMDLAVLESGSYMALKDLGASVTLHAACGVGFFKNLAIPMIEAAPPPPRSEPITPLHFAARTNNYDVVKALIEKGYDVNARSKVGYLSTPLHWAVMEGRADMATLLLWKGADPTIKDVEGLTPLEQAKKLQFEEVVKLLEDWQNGIKKPFVEIPTLLAPAPEKPVKPPRPPDDVF